MVRLYKFYELISRNAMVTLTNRSLDKIYYEGSLKNIPSEYDDCTVADFAVSNDGDFLFKINVETEKH